MGDDDCAPMLLESADTCASKLELTELPPEILVRILRQLSAKEVCLMRQACWSLMRLADDSFVWKGLVKRDFGDNQGTKRRELPLEQESPGFLLEPWWDVYKRSRMWTWDRARRYPWIRLSNNDRTATHIGNGYYHVVRCSRGVGEGVHYFEVLVAQRKDLDERERLRVNHTRSVGFCSGGLDYSMRNLAGWGGTSNGVGWYANGNVHPCYPAKALSYEPGDVLGLVLCNKRGENPFLCLFKNGVRASNERYYVNVAPSQRNPHEPYGADGELLTFFMNSFLSGGDEITLLYAGEKPRHVDLY